MNDALRGIERSYLNAKAIRKQTNTMMYMSDARQLDLKYRRAYRDARNGGDKFHFYRATRAYLKALRALSTTEAD